MFGINPRKEYRRLQAVHEAARQRLDDPEARLQEARPEVSGWSPAQHLHHMALVNAAAVGQLCRWVHGEVATQEGRPNAAGRLILWRGRLPRGRGRAPEAFHPDAAPDGDMLERALTESRSHLEALAPYLDVLRRCPGGVPHPVLGVLTAMQWLRFARIHAEHHLAIVRDIEKHRS